MTPAQIESIVRKAVREGVREEFMAIGLLTHDPEDQMEARKDFALLRTARLMINRAATHIGYTILLGLFGLIMWCVSAVKGPWPKV